VIERVGKTRHCALSRAVDELELMTIRRGVSGLASADASFHRELCPPERH
jgi:hypothetical protein